METNEKLVEVLNDLIRINNDRSRGYEKAVSELTPEDVDLKLLFRKYANESKDFSTELSAEVLKNGGAVATETTFSGKVYRMWMDIKASVSDEERTSVLESCEFGEDAAKRAYDKALESDADINADIRQLILKQMSLLEAAHDTIKKYRDLHVAVK